jgi:hypothetical protein
MSDCMSRISSAPHWTLICQTKVSLFLKMKDLNNENITPLVMFLKQLIKTLNNRLHIIVLKCD